MKQEVLINFLEENWPALTFVVLGYAFGFLTSYLRARVKNKAYLADIRRLETEKESVRKEHQLDIEKRKYKYESKREQFVKYFNLLDDLAVKSNAEVQGRFLPMMTKYNEEFFGADGDKTKETAAITNFSEGIQTLMFEVNKNLIRLRSETNTIKIIADKRTVELIDQMDKLYDRTFDITGNMIKELITAVPTRDFKNVKKLEVELKSFADQILRTKELMTEQIRIELDEI